MRRAYRPRNSTRELVRRIEALDGIDSVEILAPHRGVTVQPARIRVYLTHRWPGERVYTDFSMKQAREWVVLEEADQALKNFIYTSIKRIAEEVHDAKVHG